MSRTIKPLVLAGDEPCTPAGVPLVGGLPNLKDANAAALIQALADIVEHLCVRDVPAQHVEAA